MKRNPLTNIWLILAVLSSVVLFLFTIYLPNLAKAFHTVPLGVTDWIIVLVLAAVPTFALSMRRVGLLMFRPKRGDQGMAA